MSSFFRDLRYAWRVLLKSPLATAVSVLALALGIGVNTSSFILINAMLLHPFPYPRLNSIVAVSETVPKLQIENSPLAPANFEDLIRDNASFERLAAYRSWDVTMTGTANPERLQATLVSPNFFSVFGMPAALGRTFEDRGNVTHARVAVVSEGFWKHRLASSRKAVGASIYLGGESYTIIGVMPGDFDFPLSTEVWSPLAFDGTGKNDRNTRDLAVVGLLKPGISIEQARAETALVGSRLKQQYPDSNEDRGMTAAPLTAMTNDVTNRFLVTLVGAAGFVLLLACANIGNLQLARAVNRTREMAVRAALGASKLHIGRQLFAESLLISLAAGVLGLVLASWNNEYTKSTLPAVALRVVPGLRSLRIDATVIAFTLLVSLVAGIICSVPAIAQLVQRQMRLNLGANLRERSTGGMNNVAANRLRSMLTIFELALAMVLLVGAGLMVTTFEHLLNRNQGFDPKNLLLMQIALPVRDYPDAAHQTMFYDRALERLGSLNTVRTAAVSSWVGVAAKFTIEGRPQPRPGEPSPQVKAVSSGYLKAMRIPLLQGRAITPADRANSQPVAVIGEILARHYWPHSSALGQRIKWDGKSEWLTVVGVAGDVVDDWFHGTPTPAAYVSYAQHPSLSAQFVLRTEDDPMLAAASARSEIRKIDGSLAVFNLKSMEQTIAEERSGVRGAAQSMTMYALIALLLAVTGIYALVSYFVTARTHDIGVHLALGATRFDVLKMAMQPSLLLTAIGLALGVPLAVALARLMSSVLYGVVHVSPGTFVIFASVLTFASLLASFLPSHRAAGIDPLIALRDE